MAVPANIAAIGASGIMVGNLPVNIVWDLYELQLTPYNNIIVLPVVLYAQMGHNNGAARREFARRFNHLTGSTAMFVQDPSPLRVLLGPHEYFVNQNITLRPGQLPLLSYAPLPSHAIVVSRMDSNSGTDRAVATGLADGTLAVALLQPGDDIAGAISAVGNYANAQAAAIPAGHVNIPANTVVPPPTKLKVPRPLNPFILYRKDFHDKVKADYPDIHNNEISKIIGMMWQRETADVRAEYLQMAENLKAEHARLHPDYKYQPRKSGEKKRRMTKKKMEGLLSQNS